MGIALRHHAAAHRRRCVAARDPQLVGALFFAPFLLGALAAAVFRTIGNPRSIVLGMQFAWYRSSC
jgi:hypothetical protein